MGINVANIFPKWTNKIPTAVAIGLPVVLIAVCAFIWYFFSPKFLEVGYSPKQPVPFSHKLHAGDLGMDCRYCHNTIERSSFAAVPPTQACMGCHQDLVLPQSPKLAPVRESWVTDKPIPWVNVHMLPDFVKFDHSAHLASGVGCTSCHGRVDQMKVVMQAKPMSMGWCLECHRNPTPSLRPLDQITNMSYVLDPSKYDPKNAPHRARKEVTPPLHCSGCHM